jgi:predicted acetyltransferase
MDKKDIEKIIVDGLFISERKPGNTLVDIPGMRGWSSPFDEPYANRISLIDGANVEHAIQGAIDYFKNRNSGFTWVVRPADIDAELPEKLLMNGLTPSRFHKVAGMCLKSFIASPEKNTAIRVQEIAGDEIIENIEIISRAYGNTSQEYTRYLYAPSADQDGVVSRMYLAYLQDTDEPVGYGYCSYIENNSVFMLRGAAVVPEHRGKGAYKELLKQRLSDASAEGIEKFIIQSARDSSYSACLRFGFEEVCPLELYQWSPS